jgi:hypothetical protein
MHEKRYINKCPKCKKVLNRRKRDLNKLCITCSIRKIEKKYRYMKIKENKPTVAEHCRNHALKYRNDRWHRLNRLMQGARHRARMNNLPINITTNFLMEIYPKDNKCPVLGIDLQFNSNGRSGDRSNSPSIDRVNPIGGYTKDNVRIISWKANGAKRDSTIEILESIIKYMKS